MKVWAARMETPIGMIHVSVDDGGVVKGCGFGDGVPSGAEVDERRCQEVLRQLEEYFGGGRREFQLELAPAGTPFQREVWSALCDVAFGRTTSYRQLAETVGRPRAVRAVGQANALNPIALIIPCHRVIGTSGGLVGYGGGLEAKKALLAWERGVKWGSSGEKSALLFDR
jgi:methylated-DNA-[protein]-cysteine S-methyltransferase